MSTTAEPRAGLDRVATWLATASPWHVLAVVALVRAVTVGVWTTPNVHQWVLFASDPLGTPPIDPAAAFITGSPTGPLVANAVGADTTLTYALVHLAALGLAVSLVVVMGRRWLGDRTTNLLVVLLFASSLSAVLVTWLGQPDPFVLLGLSAIAMASAAPPPIRLPLALAGGALAGFTSFEQCFGAVAVLAVASWGHDRPGDRATVLGAVVGLLVGRLALAGFHAASDVATLSRADWARAHGAELFLERYLTNLPAYAFSILGAGWLLVGDAGRRLAPLGRGPAPFVAAGAMVLGVGVIALDQTRVASLVAWPTAIWLVRRAEADDPGGARPRLAAAVLVAAAIIPPVVIWEGRPVISAWAEIFGW